EGVRGRESIVSFGTVLPWLPMVHGRQGGGRRGIGTVIVVLLCQFLGVDLTQFLGTSDGARSAGSVDAGPLAAKRGPGEAASGDGDGGVVGAATALEAYGEREPPECGPPWRSPSMELFAGQTVTGCGTATSEVGPF